MGPELEQPLAAEGGGVSWEPHAGVGETLRTAQFALPEAYPHEGEVQAWRNHDLTNVQL